VLPVTVSEILVFPVSSVISVIDAMAWEHFRRFPSLFVVEISKTLGLPLGL